MDDHSSSSLGGSTASTVPASDYNEDDSDMRMRDDDEDDPVDEYQEDVNREDYGMNMDDLHVDDYNDDGLTEDYQAAMAAEESSHDDDAEVGGSGVGVNSGGEQVSHHAPQDEDKDLWTNYAPVGTEPLPDAYYHTFIEQPITQTMEDDQQARLSNKRARSGSSPDNAGPRSGALERVKRFAVVSHDTLDLDAQPSSQKASSSSKKSKGKGKVAGKKGKGKQRMPGFL